MNEKDFRNGVMPRAQLSKIASELAVVNLTQGEAKEFAGFELMEASTVVEVLKELNTDLPELDEEGKTFIEKLTSASGNEFEKFYIEAELTNHEFLRDLAESYLESAISQSSPAEKETQRFAKLALFAFKEHVAWTKRINEEISANFENAYAGSAI